jgi:hypothetical protein
VATISITTSADQDAAVKAEADKYNTSSGETLTAVQYAKQRIDQFLNGLVQKYQADMRTTKAQAYLAASDTDKAAVDSILAKYQ